MHNPLTGSSILVTFQTRLVGHYRSVTWPASGESQCLEARFGAAPTQRVGRARARDFGDGRRSFLAWGRISRRCPLLAGLVCAVRDCPQLRSEENSLTVEAQTELQQGVGWREIIAQDGVGAVQATL